MNPSAPHPHRRRLTRAEVHRRRRSRAIRRVAGLTVMLCVAAGGVTFLLTRRAAVPSASAASAISMPAQSIADSTVSSAENTAAPANALGLTAGEARAMLADPLMVLVNHTCKMPDDYTFDTKECGSATAVNKTYLYQETKALLTPGKLKNFLVEKMRTLGTAACPPYHIAFVIGGTSAETNLKTVKLASAHYYDELPTEGNEHGQAFRDVQLEQELLEEAQKLGLGAHRMVEIGRAHV